MVMKVVKIPIHVQEATFASGGKNKAVRYLYFLDIWFLVFKFLLRSKVTMAFSKVRETIYILGLGVPERPPTEGEEFLKVEAIFNILFLSLHPKYPPGDQPCVVHHINLWVWP